MTLIPNTDNQPQSQGDNTLAETFSDEEILSPGIDIRNPRDRAILLGRRKTKSHIEAILSKLESEQL